MAVDALGSLDEHTVVVDASPDAVWHAVLGMARGTFDGKGARLFARVVGCDPPTPSGWDDPGVGTTIVGFRIVEADRPGRLVVEGRHHFSHYAIVFRVEPAATGTRCTIESRADFPGIHGRLYRLAVIGSRGHVFAVRRMLRDIERRAERFAPVPSEGAMAE
jgi:hypothetical protein